MAKHQRLNPQPSVPRLEPRLVKNRTLAHGMGLSGLKTLKILNPQISLKLPSLEKWPIPPYQELALHSFEDNSKASSLQGEVVPQDEPLPSLLATRSIIQVKSQDVPTRDLRSMIGEEKAHPTKELWSQSVLLGAGEDVCDWILSMIDKGGLEFKVG